MSQLQQIKNVPLFALILQIFFLMSCEQSDFYQNRVLSEKQLLNSQEGLANVKVINGELHFENWETYSDDLNKILAMDEKELDYWEKSIGFKSYRSWFNRSAEEFFQLKSKTQYQKWLEDYKDILFMQDNTVTPILAEGIYDRVVNRSGEFVIGNSYVKVLPDKLILIENGDRKKLSEVIGLKSSNEENGIYIMPFNSKESIIELRNSQTCGDSELSSQHTQGGDRKALLKLTLDKTLGYNSAIGYYYETVINMRAKGHKKGLFGGWNVYRTDIYVSDVTVLVHDNHGNSAWAVQNGSAYIEDVKEIELTYRVGDKTSTSSYNESNTDIIWGKGRAKTRGTGNEWTTICCNVPFGVFCPEPFDIY